VKTSLSVCVCFASIMLFSSTAQGGANYQCRGWLSWGSNWTNPVSDLFPMPTAAASLYIQLGELHELAGCEFELRWQPPGSVFSACYEFVEASHPNGSGTYCAWLMRGRQIEGMNESSDSYWRVAFASNECNMFCSSGNVARVLLDFNYCGGDVPGCFCLEYMKVTDCSAVIDMVVVIGDARILGGPGYGYPCSYEPTSLKDSTWGAIKVLYH
jgi:hypothetical protein